MRILLLLSVVAYYAESFDAVIADTNFYSKFFKTAAEDVSGNMVCSLVNLDAILHEMTKGSGGDNRRQLVSVYKADWSTSVMHLWRHPFAGRPYQKYGWHLARSYVLAKPYQLSYLFFGHVKRFYEVSGESIDFRNLTAASKEFNEWCAAHTDNHIRDVVSPDSLNATTSMVLVSAMHVNGRLLYPFNVKKTTLRPFCMNNTSKDVPTMHIIKRLRYGKLPEINASYVEVPYMSVDEFYKMSMFLILPDKVDGFEQLKENLDKVTVKRLVQNAKDRLVDLYLPKFKIESSMQLDGPLRKMGLTSMFSDDADFSELEKKRRSLRVQFFHKAVIEVNETGTEAALAMGASSYVGSGAHEASVDLITFDVNRPFVSIGAAIYQEKGTTDRLSVFGAIIVDPQS